MPTRVRKPKDKVTVENTVKQLTTYLYCSLVILPHQKLKIGIYNSRGLFLSVFSTFHRTSDVLTCGCIRDIVHFRQSV